MKNSIRIATILFSIFTLTTALLASNTEKWLFLGDSISQAGGYVDHIETWYLLNEPDAPEMINLGLSSETISGLSEADHPGIRPFLLNRLDNALDTVNPTRVIACYGMNCAVYHPLSEQRFEAYKTGIETLISKVHAIGADLILLTPPIYADAILPALETPQSPPYGYRNQFRGYNEVLQSYGDWILSLDERENVKCLNIRDGLTKFVNKSYRGDPVHPNEFGHLLMGESFLVGMGKIKASELLETGTDRYSNYADWRVMKSLVKTQREAYDRILMNAIGHGNEWVMKRFTMPLEDAQTVNDAQNVLIQTFLESKKN